MVFVATVFMCLHARKKLETEVSWTELLQKVQCFCHTVYITPWDIKRAPLFSTITFRWLRYFTAFSTTSINVLPIFVARRSGSFEIGICNRIRVGRAGERADGQKRFWNQLNKSETV